MSTSAVPVPDHPVERRKDALRSRIRAARATRSTRRRESDAQALAAVVLDLVDQKRPSCVAAYVSQPTEPGTGLLLDALRARGIRVLLPVLGSGLKRGWGPYQGAADLQVRAPGRPPEPSGPDLPPEALAEADIVIVPALAVDDAGTRLGQGGGWYDRVLQHASPDAVIVAMVHGEEVVGPGGEPLPRQPHDRPVDAVATPEGWRPLALRVAH